MSRNPFDYGGDKELDAEDYAYLEDDEKFSGGDGGSGCCLVFLIPVSIVAGMCQLYTLMIV